VPVENISLASRIRQLQQANVRLGNEPILQLSVCEGFLLQRHIVMGWGKDTSQLRVIRAGGDWTPSVQLFRSCDAFRIRIMPALVDPSCSIAVNSREASVMCV
jgi:hypothetical protein